MRILIFTDPHITTNAEFSQPTSDGLTDYLHIIIKSFDWVCEKIVLLKPDMVVCAGDLFDTTGHIDTTSLKVGVEVCTQLAKVCGDDCYLKFVMGNHDSYSLQHRIHNLHFLLSLGIDVIDRPTVLTIGGVRINFIPWVKDIDSLPQVEADVVISHVEVIGGKFNSKSICSNGIDPDSADKNVITFNGHFHHPQVLNDKFYNIGALVSRDFKDVDSDPRGLIVYDTPGKYKMTTTVDDNVAALETNGVVTCYHNPHDIPYRDVTIQTQKQADEWFKRLSSGDLGVEGSYVRVKYTADNFDLADQVACLTKGARLEVLPVELELADDSVSETFSPVDNFNEYVDSVFMFDEDGDRELVLQEGVSYINKAQSNADSVSSPPLRFKEITIHNYQAIGDVTVELDRIGVVYVDGLNLDDSGSKSNGSAKSSFCEAVYWLITGKSLRKGTGDDVIHWDMDECFVSGIVHIGTKLYKITRTKKRKHAQEVDLCVHNGVDFADDITNRRGGDTHKVLSDLIGRSEVMLRHSIFLTDGLEECFMNLSYPGRIRLLEEVTESGVYSDVEQLIKFDKGESHDRLTSMKGSVDAYANSIVNYTTRLREISGEMAEQASSSKVVEYKEALQALVAKRGEDELAMDTYHKLSTTHIEAKKVARLELDKLTATTLPLTGRLAEYNATLSHTSNSITSQDELIALGKCPTCGAEIQSESGHVYDCVVELKASMASTEHKKEIIRKKYLGRNKMVDEAKRSLEAVETTIHDSNSASEEVRTSLVSVGKQIDVLKSGIRAIRDQSSTLTVRRAEVKVSKAKAEKELTITEESIVLEEQTFRVLEFLSKAFSTTGIRSRVLSSVTLPFINNHVKEHNMGLSFQVTNKTMNKSNTVQDKIGTVFPGKRTYKLCSKGEKRKVDLPLQYAFRALAVVTGGSFVNILMADEVIDPLDDLGVKAAFDMFGSDPDLTVLLMAHKPFMDTYAKKKWTLVKEHGIAKLV